MIKHSLEFLIDLEGEICHLLSELGLLDFYLLAIFLPDLHVNIDFLHQIGLVYHETAQVVFKVKRENAIRILDILAVCF